MTSPQRDLGAFEAGSWYEPTLTAQSNELYLDGTRYGAPMRRPLMLHVKEQLPGIDNDISLVPLFRGVWRLAPYVILPNTPAGTRAVIEMPTGRLEGRGICAQT